METKQSKRSRRFFKEGFKKETVYKIKNHLMSLEEASAQYKIDKLLLKRWCERYSTIGQAPQIPMQTPQLEARLNTLIDTLIAKRLDQLLSDFEKPARQALVEFQENSHSA